MAPSLLKGKKVLLVDDELDVLETLEDLLTLCQVVKASSFEEAKTHLENQVFDLAILDIMGVDGYTLLEIAIRKKVIAVMLTAHALSLQDTVQSFRGGAAYYIPKDRMKDIVMYLTDILEAKEKGERFWWRWLDRFGSYYDKKFGPDWRKGDEEFWRNFGPWE